MLAHRGEKGRIRPRNETLELILMRKAFLALGVGDEVMVMADFVPLLLALNPVCLLLLHEVLKGIFHP